MKAFLTKLRDITISGILALLPLYVFLIVITKVWKSLNSIGAGIAQVFGVKAILGVGGAAVFSGFLTAAIWLIAGFLVRYSFLGAVSKAAERQLSKFVPDYESYKAKAEEKLQHKVRELPYTSVLIRREGYWQPGYIVERDQEGNCIVFVPETPETHKGHILLARTNQVTIVESITANQLDASLKKAGRGLLSEHSVYPPMDHRAAAGQIRPHDR